jgi:cbb3-type cytochrome oxidase subunit 1
MPKLSVWSIRAALIYLALGFTFGALLLYNKGEPINPAVWRLLPAHIDFLLFGWTVQLVIGVAFWILPRHRKPPKRGDVRVAWLSVGLLNAGVLVAAFGPLVTAAAGVSLAGKVMEAGAAVVFAVYAWPRVKPPGG